MKPIVVALAFGVLLLAPLPARAGHGGGGGGGHGGGYGGSARSGHFHSGFDHPRFGGGFGYYPSCFAYAYCPYDGCAGNGGYWIDQPYIDADGITKSRRQWIPAGC